MRKLLYLLACLIIASCSLEKHEPDSMLEKGKVKIDFSVLVPDSNPSTKTMGNQPDIDNLYLAVFDESGYLAEYVQADPTNLETPVDNHTGSLLYKYTATLSVSETPRTIHWIANGPASLQYGSEEAVIMSIKSQGDQDQYWYRKTGIVIEETPSTATLNALSNIPLVRNFAKITLVDNAENFTLIDFTVVNTLNSGFAAAYDFGRGVFVDYMYTNTETETLEAKTYGMLINEGYNASTPSVASFISLNDAWENRTTGSGSSCYVYERERPLNTEAYIIASGKYGESEEVVYYKIDLRDATGNYFPILRNFNYTITLTSVGRNGYSSIEEAANSGGSGDISTSMNTENLIYMSDGHASLEVGYTAIVVTSNNPVSLPFWFYPNINNLTELYDGPSGTVATKYEASIEIIKNNDATTAGNAIDAISAIDYNTRPCPTVYITPTDPQDVPKTQSITIKAKYKDTNGHLRSIQRKVKYTVMNKQPLTAVCVPSEVPKEKGSKFHLEISIPGGLSSGMFPLNFKIEAQGLSITPDKTEHMPVESSVSISGTQKPSFHYIKTLTYDEYFRLENKNGMKTFNAYFETIKEISATDIYVANEYFYGVISGNRIDYATTALGNYDAKHFTNLEINPDPIPIGKEQNVSFSFNMSAMPDTDGVIVTLTNLEPSETETKLTRLGIVNGKVQYVYHPANNNGKHTFALLTTSTDDDVEVTLAAHQFVEITKPALRGIVIPAGNLVTKLNNNDFSTTNGYTTISLYDTDPRTNSTAQKVAEYRFTRVRTNNRPYQYRQAYNTERITITAYVSDLYIVYKRDNNNTHYGRLTSEQITTATTEEVSVTLQ